MAKYREAEQISNLAEVQYEQQLLSFALFDQNQAKSAEMSSKHSVSSDENLSFSDNDEKTSDEGYFKQKPKNSERVAQRQNQEIENINLSPFVKQ